MQSPYVRGILCHLLSVCSPDGVAMAGNAVNRKWPAFIGLLPQHLRGPLCTGSANPARPAARLLARPSGQINY